MPSAPHALGTEALVAMLDLRRHKLTATATASIRSAVADLRARGVTADEASEDSLWLRQLIETSPELLSKEAATKLAKVQIIAVDSFHINAVARVAGNEPQIVVFAGLRHLVHFFADYITVLSHLLRLRPDAVMSGADAGEESEAFLFSAACFAILADFLRNGRPPSLIHDLLGPSPRKNVEIGYRTAIIFALLHELGHIELGHLGDGPFSEIAHVALIEPENLNLYQKDEFAADAFAVSHIAPRYRADIISSVMFLLGSFALLEAFLGGFSASHPLAINRLGAIAEASGLSADDHEIVSGWIADRARAFRKLADDRVATQGSIAGRIDNTMPIDHAYAIIAEIRARVQADHGALE